MVIVGSGECGTRAAFALREAGYAGEITLIGAEPGTPYERPPLSKPSEAGVTVTVIADADLLARADIALLDGVSARRIDRAHRTVALSDGRALPYDRLLIATGARPRPLPADPDGTALMLRTRQDAQAIHDRARGARHAVLIGAGLIGLEIAATLRARGIGVTVVEMADRALGRAVPAPLAEDIAARHRAEGVELRFGTGVAAVADGAVSLATGETLAADLILAAIGVAPDTALAQDAGLACDNGIRVDARLATSDPHIFAAGDCANCDHPRYGRIRLESWRNAQDQGDAAARFMLGEGGAFDTVPWFWSDQYDLGLQIAGLPDAAHRTVERDLGDGARILFALAPDGRLSSASGLGRGTAVGKHIRLAEMLISKGAAPAPAALADPSQNLKALLRG